MSFATLALQGIGASLGIVGALRTGDSGAFNALIKGESEGRIADARADADSFNAKVARQLAISEESNAAATAADYRRTQTSKAASARAVRADSGLALEGSPLLVDQSIFKEIDFGSSRIAYAGQLSSNRLRNQASVYDVYSENNRRTGVFARQAGKIGADNARDSAVLNALSFGAKGANEMYKTLAVGGDLPDWATPSVKKKTTASNDPWDSKWDWGTGAEGQF